MKRLFKISIAGLIAAVGCVVYAVGYNHGYLDGYSDGWKNGVDDARRLSIDGINPVFFHHDVTPHKR